MSDFSGLAGMIEMFLDMIMKAIERIGVALFGEGS